MFPTSYIIVGIIMLLLPYFLAFIFYKKNIKKLAANLKISNFRIFLDSSVSLVLSSILGGILTGLLHINGLISIAILAISYYLILKIILGKKEGIESKQANTIASNTVGAVFGIMLLIGIIAGLIVSFFFMNGYSR